MIIIGEKLNSSIPSVLEAMENRDEKEILNIIISQVENKADFLDVNTALTSKEKETMAWIIDLIQKNTKVGIMLDSPTPNVIETCIENIKDREIIINSVTLTERHELIDIALKYDTGIVALPIGNRMPDTLEKRIENSFEILDLILSKGIKPNKIYLDILVESLATNHDSANDSINTLVAVKEKYMGVKTTCGLSNISFGLPRRSAINRSFLTYAILNGLDSAILNNTSKELMDALYAALAIGGQDEFCLDYIQYVRNSK